MVKKKLSKEEKQKIIWALQTSLHELKYNGRRSGFGPGQVRMQIIDLKNLIKKLKAQK